MHSADDIVKIIICVWISFALLAGLALFFDTFLVPFTPKFQYIMFFLFMLTSIVLHLFGLLSIYHTFCTLTAYIPNIFLLNISSLYSTYNVSPNCLCRSNNTIQLYFSNKISYCTVHLSSMTNLLF